MVRRNIIILLVVVGLGLLKKRIFDSRDLAGATEGTGTWETIDRAKLQRGGRETEPKVLLQC